MNIKGKASAAALAFFVSMHAVAALAQIQDVSPSQTTQSHPVPAQAGEGIAPDGSKNDDRRKSLNRGCDLAIRLGVNLERQASIGRVLAQQIDSQTKFVSDPVVLEYVNRIGQSLARYADSDVPFTIKVIDSHAVNALSLPGGFLYVNSGLILAADEEAELAGVIAHEIAHIAVCHAGRAWSSMERAPTPWPPDKLLAGGTDESTGLYGIAYFPRGLEGEADYLGMQYMFLAGYDPSALISYLQRIYSMEQAPWKPGTVARAFRTHAQNAERVGKSQGWVNDFSSKPVYLVSDSEFDEIKARLAANRRDDSN